jgi:hypothetical protein
MPGKRKKQKGDGIIGDAVSWLGNKVVKPVGKFVKDNKIISRGLSLGAMIPGNPYAAGMRTGAAVTGALGYGKKRPAPKAMKGMHGRGGRAGGRSLVYQ